MSIITVFRQINGISILSQGSLLFRECNRHQKAPIELF